jgi:serine/threonine protein kinase
MGAFVSTRCATCNAPYSPEHVCATATYVDRIERNDDPFIGRMIEGRYRVRRQLGRGGMGTVYEADHVGLHRAVAIKFLAHRGDPTHAERFRREAHAASQVRHEHVAQVFDVGSTEDGTLYLVMEYVEGTDLRHVLAAGTIEVARAVSIGRQIALGLHAIHAAGIIHRDIKPANVLLTEHDAVKLTDFGIAKSLRDAARLTASGLVIGTPQFMAPEQFIGEPQEQVDLYALGVTLYQMLAGTLPFPGNTLARVARMHVNDAPIPLDAVRPGLPRSLVDVVARALEKSPQARFKSALELAEALDTFDPSPPTVDARGPRVHAVEPAAVRSIGRFELIRELARGGMGQVFLARDTKLGRKVAIKFMLHDDPSFVQRFLIEARATARCTHENIVTIYEVGEHEGLPYMVLELLEGQPLSQMLAAMAGPPGRTVLELLVPVLRALERAHDAGIVHRDLKPSNIFVTERGHVKVVDFGVARLMNHEERVIKRASMMMAAVSPDARPLTQEHAFVGTVPYMSPEQWGAGRVDHRSDLFAVGVILWRVLVGGHPARSTEATELNTELLEIDTPFPSIATRDPTLPRELVNIVDRCLAKRASARYPNAGELLADLQRFLAPVDPADADAHPYCGLAAFGEADAKYFFGRTNEIRTALAHLASWPLLAVIGPSGVGKSSFVHAGIVPALRATHAWRVHMLRPGRSPLQRLAAVLSQALDGPPQADELIAQLREAPGMFGSVLRAAAARRDEHVLIVVDQLEELFTLCDDLTTHELFLAALLGAADDPSTSLRVVLSMRADFLDRLASHEHFLRDLSRGLFFLTAPDPHGMRETVLRPAELAGYSFEDAAIVDDMMRFASSGGALPLLSFASARLWDARDQQRRLLTVGAYAEMGGVAGAFARHADQVAAALPPQDQILLRAILTRLVTAEGTRAVVDLEELMSLAPDRREVEQVVDRLVRGRLVHLRMEGAVSTVELVHEMLITQWPSLRRLLEDNRALRGFTQEVQQAARQWASRGKPADLLWRGGTARHALDITKRHVLDLSSLEREFLAAVARLARSTRRRRLTALVAIASVLVLASAGSAIAVIRITKAERAAQDKAADAERAAAAERAARASLQDKLDIIERERNARAEAERTATDALRTATQAQGAADLSREQLETTNRELERKVQEAEIATRRALAAEAVTKKLLDKERAEREQAEQRLKEIEGGSLRARSNR